MHNHMSNSLETTDMSTSTEQQRIGSSETKANRQWKEVTCPLSRPSWGGTRDKPKNVCVGGYGLDKLWMTRSVMFTRQTLLKHKYTGNVTDIVFFIVCIIYCRTVQVTVIFKVITARGSCFPCELISSSNLIRNGDIKFLQVISTALCWFSGFKYFAEKREGKRALFVAYSRIKRRENLRGAFITSWVVNLWGSGCKETVKCVV